MAGDGHELMDDSSLVEQHVLDSTGVLELASFLEKTFQVEVADDDLVPANLDSIERIAAYVARKCGTIKNPVTAGT
jgi:acyl carrier protein